MTEPKILYVSPNTGFSGYSHAARDYIRALDSVGANLVTRSLMYDTGGYEQTNKEKEIQSRNLNGVDIVIAHTTPNEADKKDGIFNAIYFAWETDRMPKEWVDEINKMNLAMVPCDENVKAAHKSGVTIPVVKVPHTFDLDRYNRQYKPFDMPGLEDHFKFLSICQFSKKKGIDALLKAYLSEFEANEKVVLILKLYVNAHQSDSQNEKARIHELIDKMKAMLRLPSYPKICVVHEVLNDEQISKLYKSSDCYVLPSRGEGFSITHFDALGFGLPAIGLGWGGTTEFLDKSNGWLVDYDLGPVNDMQHPFPYMYTGKEKWAEPLISSLRNSMREAFVMGTVPNNAMWLAKKQAALHKTKDFTYSKVGQYMYDTIMKHYKAWKDYNAT